jgi:RNA polymerase sigma-70 factor (ECF subfamily)
LESLVYRYQLRAIRTAFLITGDRQLAEEVVQEAFLRAYRSIRSFDPRRPFEPWFLRSVVNASLRLLMRSRREVSMQAAGGEQAFARLAAQLESPQAQLEAAETEREIREALEKLPPRQRAVMVQRYFLEMSEAEMASDSGTAAGTIKRRSFNHCAAQFAKRPDRLPVELCMDRRETAERRGANESVQIRPPSYSDKLDSNHCT